MSRAYALLLLLLAALPLMAAPQQVHPAATACAQSIRPRLCHALIAPLPPSASRHDYALHAVNSAIHQVRQTTSGLKQKGAASTACPCIGVRAADVCLQMNERAGEYLDTVRAELRPGEAAIGVESAERVRTLMSAAVTNMDTCMDAMQASNVSSSVVRRTSRLIDVGLDLVVGSLDRIDRIKPNSETWLLNNWGPTKAEAIISVIEEVPANQTVIVAKDGSGNFTSVQDAIDSIPTNLKDDQGYFKIVIKEGVYEERVVVDSHKKNLIMLGAGINRTVIRGRCNNQKTKISTYHTATFELNGDGFIARGITFENAAGLENGRAVALTNSADRSVFHECSFVGYQDTLYTHSNRQFYRKCDIYGTVDFIFGNAAAVFQNCNIYARKPMHGQGNTITAQGRKTASQTTGISIHNCTIRAAPDLESSRESVRTYLGRPWRQYSRVVYMQNLLDGLIDATGWLQWDNSPPPETLYYGEFGNYGAGAGTGNRVNWPGYRRMTQKDALQFTVDSFISGSTWLGNTSVPFCHGLVND